MINLKDTIKKVSKIASDTEDMDTALHLLDLETQLSATLKAGDDEGWDYPSIIIGILMGFAIGILVFTGDVHADELNVNLTSWHSDTSYNYNNKNYGLGYTKDFDHHWQGKVGFYQNSYNKKSLYAMANLKHDMKNWRWGVQFGFVTGYDDIELTKSKIIDGHESTDSTASDRREHSRGNTKATYDNQEHSHVKNLNAIQFMILPTATWKITKKHSLTIGYMPSFSKDAFSFASAAYNYTF